MSKLLNNLWANSPFSASFGHNLELPMDSSEPLLTADKDFDNEPTSKKCDLRIEGMTCGSCVEVGYYHAVRGTKLTCVIGN